MIRKPVNCAIKLPDTSSNLDTACNDGPTDTESSLKKRLQLVNFGHTQWGQNNWSWSVTKQEVDFTDYSNGKFSVGVAAYVTVSVNTLGIHRTDVGYATSTTSQKGSAIHRARKSSITNALKETLFSFGGNIATSLIELLEINNNNEQVISVRNESEESRLETGNRQIANLEETKNVNTKNLLHPPGEIQRSDTFQKEIKNNGNPRPPPSFTNGQCTGKTPTMQQLPVNPYPQPIPENAAYPVNQTPLPSNKPAVGGPPANQVPVKVQPILSAPLPPPPVSQPPPATVSSHTRSNSNIQNVVVNPLLEDEQVRNERKRRQRQCQEEFRLKRLHKENPS